VSVTKVGRWVCPRCSKVVETQFSASHDYPDTPKGWRPLTIPQNQYHERTEEVCGDCYAAFLVFWRNPVSLDTA